MTFDRDRSSDSAKEAIARATERAQRICERLKVEKPRKKPPGFPYDAARGDRDSEDGRARSLYLDNLLREKLGMPTLPVKVKPAPAPPNVRTGRSAPCAGQFIKRRSA
jgi:hypothetical protein